MLKLCESTFRVARGLKIRAYGLWLGLLRTLKGETLWRRRGGWWLPFHGDGDLQETQYQVHGATWFKDELQRLQHWLPKDGVVVDVGANLGFMALLFSGGVGSGGKVFAFEPSPFVYPKLVEVIEKNALRNVQCFNLGCGSVKGSETLVVPRSSGNASIKRDEVGAQDIQREFRIEIDTLDSVLLPLADRVDFLKIDTEGFEDRVLAGGDQLISRFRPVIYIELSQQFLDSSRRAIAWLVARGYTFDREPALEECQSGENFLAFPPNR